MIAAGAVFAMVNIAVQSAEMTLGAGANAVVFWQYLVALGCSLPWVLRTGLGQLRSANIGWHLLRVALAATGVQLWVQGLAFVPIWQAIALIMTSPFFVTIGAHFFLGERADAPRWGATLMGFMGGMVILQPWSDAFNWAAFYPLGAAVFWAATSVMTKKLTRTETADTITLYLLLFLTPINFGLAAAGTGFALPGNTALGLVLVAGGLTFIAQLLLARAYATADAAYLQPFDHLKLPLNVLAGFLVFGWVPGGYLWLGALMIVVASLALMRQEARLVAA